MLVRGRTLVKGTQFNSWRSVGAAAQAAQIHASRGVDELCILDIGATAEGRRPDLNLVEELTATCFSPISVGGGVRSVDDMRALLASGADKVVICTGHNEVDNLVRDISDTFGAQAVVVAIDVKHGKYWTRCATHNTECDAVLAARAVEKLGAGEILLTSVERDGTMQGYDLDLIRAVSQSVNIPVIASGGCSSYDDMHQAVKAGASAVAAGALFQFEDATPREAAHYLHEHNIEVRL